LIVVITGDVVCKMRGYYHAIVISLLILPMLFDICRTASAMSADDAAAPLCRDARFIRWGREGAGSWAQKCAFSRLRSREIYQEPNNRHGIREKRAYKERRREEEERHTKHIHIT